MIKFRAKILWGLFTLFITNCNVQQNNVSGIWKYTNTIWYAAELTLLKDSTFKFHDQGCLNQNFTEGRWVLKNGILSLSSYSRFKQVEIPGIMMTSTAKNEDSISQLLKVKLICRGPDDTTNIYFDKATFYIKDDTLYGGKNGPLLKNFKFCKVN